MIINWNESGRLITDSIIFDGGSVITMIIGNTPQYRTLKVFSADKTVHVTLGERVYKAQPGDEM